MFVIYSLILREKKKGGNAIIIGKWCLKSLVFFLCYFPHLDSDILLVFDILVMSSKKKII